MTRKIGGRLKTGETKQKIIEFIVSSPSLVVEEPEIRDYMKKKHDIREPKNIKRLLKNLSGENYITKAEKRGFENKWSIENVMQLQRIVKEYNDITTILQKNDRIISMLKDQHFKPYFDDDFYYMYGDNNQCDKCLDFPQRPDGIDCNLNDEERKRCLDVRKKVLSALEYYLNIRPISSLKEMSKNIENAINNFDGKFKEYLKISPCFFKMCLRTPAEFQNTFEKILKIQLKNRPYSDWYLKNPQVKCMTIEEGLLNYYDTVIEICVHTDIINNEASEKAIEYLYNMKRNTAELDKND